MKFSHSTLPAESSRNEVTTKQQSHNLCDTVAIMWQQRLATISADANKPVFSFLRQLTTWHCPHLRARQQSISITFCLPDPQQQTHSVACE